MDLSSRQATIELAQQAYQSGDAEHALGMLYSLPQRGETTPESMQLAGSLCAKMGRFDVAASYFLRAAPADTTGRCWLSAAACFNQLGQYEHELSALISSVSVAPLELKHQAQLARVAQQRGKFDIAMRARFACARLQPESTEHLQYAVNMACDEMLSNANQPLNRAWARSAASAPPIDIIVCSIDQNRLSRMHASLDRHWGDQSYRLIHLHDAKSLAEGFSRGIGMSTAEYVVLCHDDIEFLTPPALRGQVTRESWPQRIVSHLQHWDVIGVAGTSHLSTPAVLGSGTGHVHGWISQPDHFPSIARASMSGNGYMVGLLSAATAPTRADALDGVFVAARRSALQQVAFDGTTFDGFHGYDVDFSYRCHLAGLRVAVCPDLWLVHHSEGNFGDDWIKYAQRLHRKFPHLNAALKSATYFAHQVSDMESLQRGYDRLWAAAQA